MFQGSDLGEIIDEVLTHMRMQVENPALANSRFVFDQLNLTRDSSYLSLPYWILSKKAVIIPKNASSGSYSQHYTTR